MVAKKDFKKAKHDDPELDVPNLQVIKLMQSLKSRGCVLPCHLLVPSISPPDCPRSHLCCAFFLTYLLVEFRWVPLKLLILSLALDIPTHKILLPFNIDTLDDFPAPDSQACGVDSSTSDSHGTGTSCLWADLPAQYW